MKCIINIHFTCFRNRVIDTEYKRVAARGEGLGWEEK